VLIDLGIEQAFTTAFWRFAAALIFWGVGDETIVKAGLAGILGVESHVGIEVGTGNRQAQALEILECLLKVRFEVECVCVIACHDPGGRQHKAMPVADGQDIRGLGFLASLIGHRLAAFLGNGMTAIQVQPCEVQVISNDLNTVLPEPLQASVPAPFAIVMVDRLPADFFFVGSSGSGSMAS
jgi:hypothetical protein